MPSGGPNTPDCSKRQTHCSNIAEPVKRQACCVTAEKRQPRPVTRPVKTEERVSPRTPVCVPQVLLESGVKLECERHRLDATPTGNTAFNGNILKHCITSLHRGYVSVK
ncbi:uncharacterized protein LOC135474984 [Liolophura sinensis]|uniref:uncharacterized protein LOC135474984 n=1 Tax=Liolophura sinensis TaxID=3198878 RepID=UPI0031594C4F